MFLLSFCSSINTCCLVSCSHIVQLILLVVPPNNKYEKNEYASQIFIMIKLFKMYCNLERRVCIQSLVW